MTDSPSTSGRRRYRKVVRFGIFSSVIIPAFLGAVVGLLYARTQPVQYTAQATVRVDSVMTLGSGGSLRAKLPDMPTEQQTAASAAVARLAQGLLGTSTSVTDLQKHLKTTAASTGNVLVISYTSSSPQQAAWYANKFAEAYLKFRDSPLNSLIARVKTKIALLMGLIPHDGTVLRMANVAQLRQDEALLGQLQNGASFSGGIIISAAIPPRSPSSPRTVRDLALGLAAGLAVGICLALQRIAYRYIEHRRIPG